MKDRSLLDIFGRLVFGSALLVSVGAIIYGIVFMSPFVLIGFVAAATFGICNIPFYIDACAPSDKKGISNVSGMNDRLAS